MTNLEKATAALCAALEGFDFICKRVEALEHDLHGINEAFKKYDRERSKNKEVAQCNQN